MTVRNECQKPEFISYMSYKIKSMQDDFYKKHKIVNFFGSLINWNARLSGFLCFVSIFCIYATFVMAIVIDGFQFWYTIPLSIIICCMFSVFITIYKMEKRPLSILKSELLKEKDLKELKNYFSKEYMDGILKEYVNKNGYMTWSKFTLKLNIFNEEVLESKIKEEERKQVANKMVELESLRNRIY